MTDRKEEENIREEIRRSQAAPRRGKRVLTVVLTLVVVLAVVVAAAWKDLSSLDSVRRLFSTVEELSAELVALKKGGGRKC